MNGLFTTEEQVNKLSDGRMNKLLGRRLRVGLRVDRGHDERNLPFITLLLNCPVWGRGRSKSEANLSKYG
jgi:hypothetical protein